MLLDSCLATNVIYKAEVITTDDMSKKRYIGMTAGPFKLRYNNHKKSFRDPDHGKDTVLSNYNWKLKKIFSEMVHLKTRKCV